MVQSRQGHRRRHSRGGQARQRLSGPGWWTASSIRHPSVSRWSSVRANGRSDSIGPFSASWSKMANRRSTSERSDSSAGFNRRTLSSGLGGGVGEDVAELSGLVCGQHGRLAGRRDHDDLIFAYQHVHRTAAAEWISARHPPVLVGRCWTGHKHTGLRFCHPWLYRTGRPWTARQATVFSPKRVRSGSFGWKFR